MFKRVEFLFGAMFSRPLFGVEPERQGRILNTGAELVDSGLLKLPDVRVFPLTVEGLRAAHEAVERGDTIGKIVLSNEASH